MDDFDAIQLSGRGCEGFEHTHAPNTLYYELMFLLDQIIQEFRLYCLNFSRATNSPQVPVHFLNTCCVGSVLIDYDLPGLPIDDNALAKNLVAAGPFHRSGSTKSWVFPALSTVR
nr:hypothetical protein [Ruegeria atlantica]